MTYGQLEAVTFELSRAEVEQLLWKAGEIPQGFLLDRDAFENDWPVTLRFKRFTPKPPVGNCQCNPLDVRGEHGNLEVFCPKCGLVHRAASPPTVADKA